MIFTLKNQKMCHNILVGTRDKKKKGGRPDMQDPSHLILLYSDLKLPSLGQHTMSLRSPCLPFNVMEYAHLSFFIFWGQIVKF